MIFLLRFPTNYYTYRLGHRAIMNALTSTKHIEEIKGKTVIEFMQILGPKILQFPTEAFSQAWILAQKYYEDASPNNLFLFKEIHTYKMKQQ